MSRSSHYHQQHPHPHSPYTDPDLPIPYRGQHGHPFSPQSATSTLSTASAPVDPSNEPDGGWGLPGPLLEGRARAQAMQERGNRRFQNRAANWVQQQALPQPRLQHGPTDGYHRAPSPPIEEPVMIVTASRVPIDAPKVPSADTVASQNETTEVQIGEDGWPSPTSPNPELEPEGKPSTDGHDDQTESEVVSDAENITLSTQPSPPSSRSARTVPEVDHGQDLSVGDLNLSSPPPPPHTFVPGLHGRLGARPPYVQPYSADPNVLHVQNPRQWGVPVSRSPTPSAVEDAAVSERSDSPATARPDSAPPIAPAVTAYISDDEDDTAHSPPPANDGDDTSSQPEEPATAKSDEVEPEVQDWPAAPAPRSSRPPIQGVEANGVPIPSVDNNRPRRRGPYRGPGARGEWWKKEPHPAYSYEFADRRLLVSFPYPFRLDSARDMMFDHFSRYGTVRCVAPQQSGKDVAERAIVVFTEAESIDVCLADPGRLQCQNRSFNSISTFDIEIERLAPNSMTKTIFIKLSGPRPDARARSASPTPTIPSTGDADDYHARQAAKPRAMPAHISVWAMPHKNKRTGRVDWWPRIFDEAGPDAFLLDAARADTRQEPVLLQTVDLGRRTLERNIVPLLCQFFGEITHIVPPSRRDQGWLITISGQRDAERIMNEVGSIPGFTARWANEGDGIDDQCTPNRSPRSPIGRFEKQSGSRIARPGQPVSPKSSTQGSPPSHQSAGSAPPPTPPLSPQTFGPELPSEYPHLRKTTAPMYHGRLLREIVIQGVPRFIDEAAVFVGRLVKEKETEATLLQRFQKYGNVCRIEYRPSVVQTTYATARILFSDVEPANRAIQHEGHAVSFGSALKLEVRRVLPQDVRIEEIYIDGLGRPVSPSMASQYSPPHTGLVPGPADQAQVSPVMFTLPPAIPTGPPPSSLISPPPPPPMGFQPGLPYPAHFWPVSYIPDSPTDGGDTPVGVPQGPPPLYFGHPPIPPMPSQLEGPAYPGPHFSPGAATSSPTPLNLGYVPVYPQVPVQYPTQHGTPPVPTGPVATAVAEQHPSIPSQRQEAITPPPIANPPPQSPNAPKLMAVKTENGVLKAVYDPEAVRRYQSEQQGSSSAFPDEHERHTPHHPELQTPSSPAAMHRAHTSPGHPRGSQRLGCPTAVSPPRRGSLAQPHLQQRAIPIPIPVFGHHQQEGQYVRHDNPPAMACTPHEAYLAHMGYGYPHPQPNPHEAYADMRPPQLGRQRRGGRGGVGGGGGQGYGHRSAY